MTEVVSSFELLFKDQSPEPPDDVDEVARVIQGYFLSISNLSEESYRYALEFKIVDPGAGLPQRSLTDNTVVIIDVPDDDNRFTRLRSVDGESFFIDGGPIEIPAHGTALVAVLPQIFGPVPGDPTPIEAANFEVRGFVRISLPPISRFAPAPDLPGDRPVAGAVLSFQISQGADPVPTLLTPQYRASYLTREDVIVDQTQATVPTGNGAGVVSITPDPGRVRPGAALERALDLEPVLNSIPQEARAPLLMSLLASADAESDEEVQSMNALLKQAGATLELKRRK